MLGCEGVRVMVRVTWASASAFAFCASATASRFAVASASRDCTAKAASRSVVRVFSSHLPARDPGAGFAGAAGLSVAAVDVVASG